MGNGKPRSVGPLGSKRTQLSQANKCTWSWFAHHEDSSSLHPLRKRSLLLIGSKYPIGQREPQDEFNLPTPYIGPSFASPKRNDILGLSSSPCSVMNKLSELGQDALLLRLKDVLKGVWGGRSTHLDHKSKNQ